MQSSDNAPANYDSVEAAALTPLDIAAILAERWRLLIVTPVAIGATTLGLSFLITPTFTARTTFLPPQQQQGSATAALASLGALASLAGGAVKTSGDQYVALMQSVNVEDRIVDKFNLMDEYKAKYRFAARLQLEGHVRIALGKKDGLISVEVDHTRPETAAAIANQYVQELRRLSSELALTEAQQRRSFFEGQVKLTKEKLTQAQEALQNGGFNADAMKIEPKTATESFARVKASVTAAEVKLQIMRRSLADTSPEVQQQIALVGALRGQLAQLEQDNGGAKESADYIGRYREFKYQEALFELFSKQFEVARVDESRDGPLLQVVDIATTPEYKSKPKRAFMAISAAFGSGVLLVLYVLARHMWAQAKSSPRTAEKIARLDRAWRRR